MSSDFAKNLASVDEAITTKLTPPDYEAQARALLARGHNIISILPGEKRPDLKGWQTARFGVADLPRFRTRGVGVLCGQGAHPIIALDIDTTHPGLAEHVAGWCATRLGLTVERVGKPPKRLLVYRAAEAGWTKTTGEWFVDEEGDAHRFEALGKGQQFVAYGMHPDTGLPYSWVDCLGGLTEVDATDLPVVTRAQVKAFADEFSAAAERFGLKRKTPDSKPAREVAVPQRLEPDREIVVDGLDAADHMPLGLTLDEARRFLRGMNLEDYDAWLKAGMALHHEFGTSEGGLALWDEASGACANYKGYDDLAYRWAGFGKAVANGNRSPVTMRTIIKMAGGNPNLIRRSQSELGNAERMLDRYGRGLRFVPEAKRWLVWTGKHWRYVTDAEIKALAVETVRAMTEDVDGYPSDQQEQYLKHCAASRKRRMIEAMVELASCDPQVMTPLHEFDKHPQLLGCANGVVNLRTGEFLKPDPSQHLTLVARAEYHPRARSELFEETVHDVFGGDADMIAFFQSAVGYSICAEPSEDKIFIPYGGGSNGKNTLLGAIHHALGDHAGAADPATFTSCKAAGGNAGGARPDVLAMRGKRLVLISEPDEGAELREGFIKSITGADVLAARALYSSDIVEVRPSWVCWMPTNHKPIVKGDDYAIWRRLVLVPFLQKFGGEGGKPKDNRRDELRKPEHLPGILAWCVRGALEYQKRGLCPPPDVDAAGAAYRADMDLLGDWLCECCDVGDGATEGGAALWNSWRAYAEARGELRFIASARHLGRRLESRGFTKAKHAGGRGINGFRGLRLKAFGDL